MRNIISLNDGWLFVKNTLDINADGGAQINLPHTWNAEDGYDGGNDYFRGSCLYKKTLKKSDLPESDLYYLEFRGANSSADVYVNGKKLAHHDGGYSTWRVNITDELDADAEISVIVDNAPNDRVYPQMADFTFYGGLYRGVNLVCVNNTHFDLDYFGAPGIKITPAVNGGDASVEVEVYTTNLKDGQTIRYTLYDKDGNEISKIESSETKVSFDIKNVHLWNGRKDPYLYSCKAEIVENGDALDAVSSRFGCRTYEIDPNRGFILNGEVLSFPCFILFANPSQYLTPSL